MTVSKFWNQPPTRKLRKMNEGERVVFDTTLKSINEGAWDVASLYAKPNCGTCRGKGWYGFDIILPGNLTINIDGKESRTTPQSQNICPCVEKRLEREIIEESSPDIKKRNMARV
jgi:hypothetical protein